MEEEKIYCKKCGQLMKKDDKFCGKCGKEYVREDLNNTRRKGKGVIVGCAICICLCIAIIIAVVNFAAYDRLIYYNLSGLFLIGAIIFAITGKIKYRGNKLISILFWVTFAITVFCIMVPLIMIASCINLFMPFIYELLKIIK